MYLWWWLFFFPYLVSFLFSLSFNQTWEGVIHFVELLNSLKRISACCSLFSEEMLGTSFQYAELNANLIVFPCSFYLWTGKIHCFASGIQKLTKICLGVEFVNTCKTVTDLSLFVGNLALLFNYGLFSSSFSFFRNFCFPLWWPSLCVSSVVLFLPPDHPRPGWSLNTDYPTLHLIQFVMIWKPYSFVLIPDCLLKAFLKSHQLPLLLLLLFCIGYRLPPPVVLIFYVFIFQVLIALLFLSLSSCCPSPTCNFFFCSLELRYSC